MSIAMSAGAHSMIGGAASYFGSEYCSLLQSDAKWAAVANVGDMPAARMMPRTTPQPVP